MNEWISPPSSSDQQPGCLGKTVSMAIASSHSEMSSVCIWGLDLFWPHFRHNKATTAKGHSGRTKVPHLQQSQYEKTELKGTKAAETNDTTVIM